MANLSRFLITNAMLNVGHAIQQILHEKPPDEYVLKTLRNVQGALEDLIPIPTERKRKKEKKEEVRIW